VAEPDDDALVARVAAGDQAAFARLVERHLGSVHRYLGRLTGSAADAEELTQETFLRLWQRAGSYRPGTARLSTWLHRVAHNLAVDALRRNREVAIEAEPGDPPAEAGADPATRLSAWQTGQQLDRALRSLPTTQRAALLLCRVQGLGNREAAAVLGVSVRALESLLARARRRLRQALQDAEPMTHRTGDETR
jgi:RNA polymerase sigma-70 factor (ECF subfamily)